MLDLERVDPETLRPITRAELHRMVEQGLFEDERIELLRGFLVRMSPQGDEHAESIRNLNDQLLPALLGRARCSPQLPFGAADDSEPEPDFAVNPLGTYADGHPTEASLVVEVALTSLEKDRDIKGPLYAEAGVPEYWIVNLVDRVIEVYRNPMDDGYTTDQVFGPGQAITLQVFPDIEIAVDAILP